MSTAASCRLLVVDDEPDLRTLYELTLLREGYDVDSAGTVQEAWQRLQARPYHAVITDVRLPDGSGLELLRRLEADERPEKTIVITAYGSAENAVEALKAGAFDYLTKPVDLRQFRSVVASALGRPGPTVNPAAALPRGRSGALAGPGAAAPGAGGGSGGGPGGPAGSAEGGPGAAAGSGLRRLAGQSQAMQQLRALIERVARGMAPVMVQGESGTGKELVARAIHEVSARASMPFIAVNCSAIPEQLLEAEFFGYRKGAFTGAGEDRPGFFQAAQGGTLFLDEIGDLPLSMQSKLLRAIQERSVRQLGAVSEIPVNVRIISATHKDLAREVQDGRFRQDLYYRLNVIQLRIPPLRERLEDLAAICAAVLDRIARDAGVSPAPQLAAAALQRLAQCPFHGNVRELENLLHRAVTLRGGDWIQVQDLGLDHDDDPGTQPGSLFGDDMATVPAALMDDAVPRPPAGEPLPAAPGEVGGDTVAAALMPDAGPASAMAPGLLPMAGPGELPEDLVAYLDGVEREVLVRALARHRNNRTAAGASLGLSLRQMRYRMARLGIAVGEGGEGAEG